MEISSVPAMTKEQQPLWKAAQALEARFLAEMLKSAGLGETPEGFGGGHGEDQFASFLREQHADQIAKSGGVGLAQSIFESLSKTRT